MNRPKRIACGTLLTVDLSIGITAIFVEVLLLPAIITTASSFVILGITVLIKLMHLKKAKQIAEITTGEKKIMKNKITPKLKAVAKYIFVSNPVTFFCASLPVLLLVANGATDGFISSNLLWFTSNETIVNTVFYSVVGLLGLTGACVAGLESNAQADARKTETKKRKEEVKAKEAEKARLAQARSLACQKLAQEQQAHFAELLEEAKCELAEAAKAKEQAEREAMAKANTPQDILGYINEENVYVLSSVEGSPKTHPVTPESTRTAYHQAKQMGATGFVAITHRGQYGFDEMSDRHFKLPASQSHQQL